MQNYAILCNILNIFIEYYKKSSVICYFEIKLNNMLKEERHQKILNEVSLRNRILLTDMAEQLNVSVDTIRRDVTELDKNLMLKKVHGGAISLGFITNNETIDVFDLDEKKI